MFSIKVCLNLRTNSFRVCSISRLNESLPDLNHNSKYNLVNNLNSKFIHSSSKSSFKSSFNTSHNLFNSSYHSSRRSFHSTTALNVVLVGSTLSYLFFQLKDFLIQSVAAKQEEPQLDQDELVKHYGNYDKRFKTITADELSKHNSKENRIYVAFKEGVYDITDFVDQHPGGEVVLMAAGNRIDSFWQIYQNHITKKTLELLESYRVANIELEVSTDIKKNEGVYDPFANDPKRNPMLKVHTVKPFNAETPSNLIGKDFLTPNSVFFVRNHLPVPEISEKDYRLEVEGFGLDKTYEFTLDELKKFPQASIITTIQCAGNRRDEFNKYDEVKGLPWQKGAIGNAKWTGVYLVDLLKSINCDLKDKNIKHIICEGHDFDPTSKPYSASIQSEFGLDPSNQILIAYKMNDQDIPRDHGYPVRFIAPGIAGARNVKWLAKITLSDEEADSHWQRGDYKSFTPNTNISNVDFKKGYSIQQLPIQSAICEPNDHSKVSIKSIVKNGNKIKICGYAYSGGKRIIRVDVAKNDGEKNVLNWQSAKLFGEDEFEKKTKLDLQLRKSLITFEEHRKCCEQLPTDNMNQDKYKSWSWVLWSVELKIDENELKKGNKIELICKATDSNYNTQAEDLKSLWNFRGVLNNAWHKIQIELVD